MEMETFWRQDVRFGKSELRVAGRFSRWWADGGYGMPTYLEGTAWSSMRPFMKLARLAEASLTASASLERVSFCMSSSSTLTDFSFSVMVAVWVLFVKGKVVGIVS